MTTLRHQQTTIFHNHKQVSKSISDAQVSYRTSAVVTHKPTQLNHYYKYSESAFIHSFIHSIIHSFIKELIEVA